MDALKEIRNEIDALDKELIEVFAKRLALVKKVGEIKHKQGLPIYVPEREADMLAARRQEAEKMGVPADLIEDVLRRLMRESYVSENHFGFKTVNPEIHKIVIVGGNGKLGGLFARFLRASGYQVAVLGSKDWEQAQEILSGADVVIVCVPINKTLETIARLKPYLTENMLLTDLTSVKRQPLEKMLEVHRGAVVGLHPMFGPDIASMAKQVVVRFAIWGAKIYQVDAAEHDHSMTYIQALRHFSTFANGYHLSRQPIKLANILALSSPIYRLELAMIGRLFAQDGSLYADIIMDKPENLAVIESLKQSYEESLKFFETGDKEGFIKVFDEVREWFGEYSEQFMKESRQLLQQANDYRHS